MDHQAHATPFEHAAVHGHAIDQHAHFEHIVTPLTQMIGSAIDNLTNGMTYLHTHPVVHH